MNTNFQKKKRGITEGWGTFVIHLYLFHYYMKELFLGEWNGLEEFIDFVQILEITFYGLSFFSRWLPEIEPYILKWLTTGLHGSLWLCVFFVPPTTGTGRVYSSLFQFWVFSIAKRKLIALLDETSHQKTARTGELARFFDPEENEEDEDNSESDMEDRTIPWSTWKLLSPIFFLIFWHQFLAYSPPLLSTLLYLIPFSIVVSLVYLIIVYMMVPPFRGPVIWVQYYRKGIVLCKDVETNEYYVGLLY